ncbi:hypothetical protein [Bradyrhizobium yuanmingense]|uniref:hypothetical protein n=1 Tax=Bradyrhizobium yuanmingense TaxID=108015 RepID=UPI0023B8FF20|nr:hypothetical protein [Bradyrhizobium yuanmingense]MDF0498240.1 hypothetical protein [Bradyrhizobium yuanmingense]
MNRPGRFAALGMPWAVPPVAAFGQSAQLEPAPGSAAGEWLVTVGARTFAQPGFEDSDEQAFGVRPILRRRGTREWLSLPIDHGGAMLFSTGSFRLGPSLKFIQKRDDGDHATLRGLGTVHLGLGDRCLCRILSGRELSHAPGGQARLQRPSGFCSLRLRRSTSRRSFAAFASFLVLSCHPGALAADSIVHRYSIRLAGVPIGSAMLDTSLMTERYAAKVSADVGWLGITYHVEGEAAGRRSGLALTPETFRMVIPRRTPTTITMRFAGQTVADYAIAPPIASDDLEKRIPITEAQLKRVMDPISAIISASFMRDRDPGQLCRGSTSIFLGLARFDVRLEPKMDPASKGMQPLVTCRVIYTPVAGHQSDEPGAMRLAASPDIEAVFQWDEGENIWAVSRITVPMSLGRLVVQRRP